MRPAPIVTGLTAVALAIATALPASAGAGGLDPTFGDEGVAILENSIDGVELVHDVVVLPDGSLFGVGLIEYESAGPFATYHHLSSTGQQLPIVGTSGFDAFEKSALRAAAITPEGKIVVAGWAGSLIQNGNVFRTWFLVARFLPTGAPDPTFSGDGLVATPMGWSNANANDVLVRSDGRIVVVGDAERGDGVIAVARYRLNGTLDTSFGTNGRSFVSAPGGLFRARAAALAPNGQIVVAATNPVTLPGGALRPRFAIARLAANGTLDTAFGSRGVATVTFGTRFAEPTDVVVRPDGRIIVAGTARDVSAVVDSGRRFALARLTTAGRIDLTFDVDGRVLTRFAGGGGTLEALVRQTDGSLVAAGWGDPQVIALARYRPNGKLDTSFGTNGMVRLTQVPQGVIEALALQADGRIVAAGWARGTSSSYGTSMFARFIP